MPFADKFAQLLSTRPASYRAQAVMMRTRYRTVDRIHVFGRAEDSIQGISDSSQDTILDASRWYFRSSGRRHRLDSRPNKDVFVTFDADDTTHPFDCEPIIPQLSVRLSAIKHVA
jgi:hypothetical protein